MLWTRVSLGTLMIVALAGLMYVDHLCEPWSPVFVLLTASLSLKALSEFYGFVEAREGLVWRRFGYIWWLVGLACVWYSGIKLPAGHEYTDYFQWRTVALQLPVLVFVLFLTWSMLKTRLPGATQEAANTVFGVLYVGLFLSFTLRIRMDFGIPALLAYITASKFSDIGGYLVGRKLGRTKLIPRLSPGKSVEGTIAGIVTSAAGGVIWHYATIDWATPLFSSVGFAIVFGVIMGALGLAGDLVESLWKRDAAVKDSAQMVPAFGGALDIVDSLLLTAPVAYLWFALSEALSATG